MNPPNHFRKLVSLQALVMSFSQQEQVILRALASVHHELGLWPHKESAIGPAFEWAELAGPWPIPRDVLDEICNGELAGYWRELLSTLTAVQVLIGPESLGLKLICVPPWFDPYHPWSRREPAVAADSSPESKELDPAEWFRTEEIEEESEPTFGQALVPNRRHNRRPN